MAALDVILNFTYYNDNYLYKNNNFFKKILILVFSYSQSTLNVDWLGSIYCRFSQTNIFPTI